MPTERQRCAFCRNWFHPNSIAGYGPTTCESCFRKSAEAEQVSGPVKLSDLLPGIVRRIFRRRSA